MDPTSLILAFAGIALGSVFLLLGNYAMLSQNAFLRLYNRWQKVEQFGIKPFDLDYFGGRNKLRLLGAMLAASGLFIIISVVAIQLHRIR